MTRMMDSMKDAEASTHIPMYSMNALNQIKN